MNDLMFAGMAGMIAVWLLVQLVPAGVAAVEAALAVVFVASLVAALVGGGVMR